MMFNRITFSYSSENPAEAEIEYTTDGAKVSDKFYLEPSEDGTFALLIKDAVEGKTADDLKIISVTGGASIKEFKTDTAEVPKEAFLEKDGVRLGITLEMGGAIASLYDEKAPAGYTNLLNRCDTGRLVQQSYYGCAEPPYELGEFMGNPWPYNPVQGGDKGGFRSRIIEFSRSEDEIYIKAQPYDWGHIGSITPSYMENRYRFLEGGLIRVDNRFVDYSGLTHGARSQELPAFYVVSALDIFTWEDAGKRSSRDDMIFWPDASDQNFRLTDPDSAFCVWHDKSGYGVGLAVPGVETYYAGRFQYNGSADPHNGATNYVAPLKTIRLRSYKPLSYSYLLSVGDIETTARRFKEALPGIRNTGLN